MRKLAAACALAALTLAAGCGSDDSGSADDSATATAASSAAAPTSSDEATQSSAAGTPSPSDASSERTPLTGTVGTTEDPDAFVITLTDSSGQAVTTLPAGDYSIAVHDPSAIHNFHLVGGAVDDTTTVPEVVDTTFDVTLTAGEYTFKCDPHPRMIGSFTVT
jgi:plastocyanin